MTGQFLYFILAKMTSYILLLPVGTLTLKLVTVCAVCPILLLG